MEVIGIVAAILDLINPTKSTIGLVRDASNSRKALSKVTDGLEPPLQVLADVLHRIEAQRDAKLASWD